MVFLPQLSVFVQIVLIDVALAGDNAIVVGMAAAGLPERERHRAILIGIGAAAVLRILFAFFAVKLLGLIGLTLAGGLLLLWVSWKLYEQLRGRHENAALVKASSSNKLRDAVVQIVVADVSMSLDNILAVAGAAREHPWILVAGLALSVILMGLASAAVVKLLRRFRWVGYAGLAVVIYVALKMIFEGCGDVATVLTHL